MSVWIINLILKPAVSLSVACWEYDHFTSLGLCVLKARMRGAVELCQDFSVGAVLLSRGFWKFVGVCCFVVCQVGSSCVRHPAVLGQACQTKTYVMSFVSLE